MAWVQIIDSDANGGTPQPYTDTQGHSTTMTVASSNGQASTNYSTGAGALQNNWIVGDNASYAAEFHLHKFSEPVHVLRVDVHYLNNGDAANFAYTDINGIGHSINIQQWITNGDATINLASDHRIQAGIPNNSTISVIRGTTPNNGTEGGTTTIEFYFPEPATEFSVGKNTTTTTGASDSYGYELYYDDVASITCFTRGMLIETSTGAVAVEDLKIGDLVKTVDQGFQPIRWTGLKRLSSAALMLKPNLRPIRIAAGALGPKTPSSDLVVSPQHRILVRSRIAQRMFGTDEVLVSAVKLLELDGVEIVEDAAGVEYYHFMFDKHQLVISNDAVTESLYPGAEVFRGIGPTARSEILQLFPELAETVAEPVRKLIPGRLGQKLVGRHIKNNLPITVQDSA